MDGARVIDVVGHRLRLWGRWRSGSGAVSAWHFVALQGTLVTGRVRSLDALRTIAVVMVIACHWATNYPHDPFARFSGEVGWAGVDLFFVLSGFLVSGLLFREHQHYGDVHAGRFLIRRGFKIY